MTGGPDGIAPPVPGLDQVARLVAQLRETGADIGLTIDGDTAALPATTGSAVYRIVQEALTNAARHAPGRPVTVRVAVTRGQVEVCGGQRRAARPGLGRGPGAGQHARTGPGRRRHLHGRTGRERLAGPRRPAPSRAARSGQ